MTICDIKNSKCVPCEGGVPKNTNEQNERLLQQLNNDWCLIADGQKLQRKYQFKTFAKTMFFVNAVAHIADQQFHHPDIEFGYNYCTINYSTHAVDGLTDNDFICAAMVDKLLPN